MNIFKKHCFECKKSTRTIYSGKSELCARCGRNKKIRGPKIKLSGILFGIAVVIGLVAIVWTIVYYIIKIIEALT